MFLRQMSPTDSAMASTWVGESALADDEVFGNGAIYFAQVGDYDFLDLFSLVFLL